MLEDKLIGYTVVNDAGEEIADTIFDVLKPVGVMVVMEAEHTCMTVRGVKKPGAITITSAIRGGFRKDPRTRAEAMALITGSDK